MMDEDWIVKNYFQKPWSVVDHERENLTDQQIFMFIFTSGVSTAKEVTDISGRGVGMDVVKREVEKLVANQWRLRQAVTAFLIKLPLTTSSLKGWWWVWAKIALLYPFWMYT